MAVEYVRICLWGSEEEEGFYARRRFGDGFFGELAGFSAAPAAGAGVRGLLLRARRGGPGRSSTAPRGFGQQSPYPLAFRRLSLAFCLTSLQCFQHVRLQARRGLRLTCRPSRGSRWLRASVSRHTRFCGGVFTANDSEFVVPTSGKTWGPILEPRVPPALRRGSPFRRAGLSLSGRSSCRRLSAPSPARRCTKRDYFNFKNYLTTGSNSCAAKSPGAKSGSQSS